MYTLLLFILKYYLIRRGQPDQVWFIHISFVFCSQGGNHARDLIKLNQYDPKYRTEPRTVIVKCLVGGERVARDFEYSA